MRRLALAVVTVLASAVAASAQPVVTGPLTVVAGGSANLTIQGTPGENYVLGASATNAGFSYAGVNFALGLDVVAVSVGVIPAGGTVVVPYTPPFPQQDRVYLQAITSPSAAFLPPVGSNGFVLINNQEARIFMAIGGGVVGATGAGFALSPGVTTVRNSAGSYTVSFANQFTGPNVIPNIAPFCGGLSPSSISANNGSFTVTFTADCGFFFTATPIRR